MAINTSALNTVYNHYLTSYSTKGTTKYDTHKKSELRNIYHSIVKQNKESPLYILDTSKESQQFAVGIKENSRELKNTIASMGGMDYRELLSKKIAHSSNTNIADAHYLGEDSNPAIPSFDIEVTQMATAQTNTGNYIKSDEQVSLPAEIYSFDVNANDLNYEFQFYIKETDTNLDLQKKLSNLINNANIGLEANILEDGEGNSSLTITSKNTGLADGKNEVFSISDEHTSKSKGTVGYLGIGSVTRPATNAQFSINGNERTSRSNTFMIEKLFEVTITGVSPEPGMTASIGIKSDTDYLRQNISKFVGSYNDFIKSAAAYQSNRVHSGRLLGELERISSHYSSGLSSMGLSRQTDGTFAVDETKIQDIVDQAESVIDDNDALAGLFQPMKNFSASLLRKANQISLNPMNYVDKTIVAYKNPGHNFATPYVTSAYSGMMFNSYC